MSYKKDNLSSRAAQLGRGGLQLYTASAALRRVLLCSVLLGTARFLWRETSDLFDACLDLHQTRYSGKGSGKFAVKILRNPNRARVETKFFLLKTELSSGLFESAMSLDGTTFIKSRDLSRGRVGSRLQHVSLSNMQHQL